MLSVHCPNCGGTNIFDETKKIPTFCGFCGAHLPDMTQFVKDSLKIEANRKQLDLDRQRHAMEIETLDKQIKKEKTNNSGTIFGYIVIILGLLFFFWLFSNLPGIKK